MGRGTESGTNFVGGRAAFTSAAVVTIAVAAMSWLAFGSDSWHAFFHWMPTFSQAFFTEGRAT